jgi:hypothetical protein
MTNLQRWVLVSAASVFTAGAFIIGLINNSLKRIIARCYYFVLGLVSLLFGIEVIRQNYMPAGKFGRSGDRGLMALIGGSLCVVAGFLTICFVIWNLTRDEDVL